MRPEEVVAEAVAATGLDDFGGDEFREGLDVFCGAVSTEAHLNDFGDIADLENVDIGGTIEVAPALDMPM